LPAKTRQPLRFFRLHCGRRRYGGWKADRLDAFRAGLREGVTFEDPPNGTLHLGPLAWIEVGERRYARSRTVSVGRQG